jgi:FkbM family methyltransferase
LKNFIIKILHFLFGYELYLKIFSVFKIGSLRFDKRKSDFLFFENLLGAETNIIVIGACTGITTIPLARYHTNRCIFAYEPLSSNFRALTRIITHYQLTNIHAFNIGLGNKKEEKKIILPVLNGVKKQGMAHLMDPSIKNYNDGISETVSIDRLDNRIELLALKISGIKIVAENFESQIIEGAKQLIEKNKPLIYCELWDNEQRLQVFNLIGSYNYTIFFNKNNQLMPYTASEYSGKNFFFKCNT